MQFDFCCIEIKDEEFKLFLINLSKLEIDDQQ